MKGQGTVKGILVTGADGHEYLLGFEPTRPVATPVLSRRTADGRFEPVTDLEEASRLAARHLGLGPQLVGPGMGRHMFLWNAFQQALAALPQPPRWPTGPR
jgi:hypothetical protein